MAGQSSTTRGLEGPFHMFADALSDQQRPSLADNTSFACDLILKLKP